MFATLPDFTPRDSHSLWYTSSRNPLSSLGAVDTTHHAAESITNQHGATQQRQRSQMIIERTALARLAADEHYMHRRRLNVQNFGSTWLRPPGVAKTLHQTREEKREQEEHQEAMRREQMQQELADAEGGMMDEGLMDDVQLDGAQDLDDEIPDADEDFAINRDDDEDEDEDEEEEEEDDENEDEENQEGGVEDDDDDDEEEDGNEEDEDEQAHAEDSMLSRGTQREERRDLMAARMRISDDAFREALVRGDSEGDGLYGGEEEEGEGDEADRAHLLDEEDFADGTMDDGTAGAGDMGANLDDDIPEAEDGGYEHTDSEAEFTSASERDDEDDNNNNNNNNNEDEIPDVGFAPRAAPFGPPQSPTLRSRLSLPRYRASMDLSGLLSQDESSFMDSSPAQGRRARRR